MPPERVKLPTMELALKVPPRLSVPVLSTFMESLMPELDQAPAVASVPVLAHKVPSLVQLVPVMVMTFPAASALMVPWLARPKVVEPTVPPWPLAPLWMRMVEPMSSVEPVALEATTLLELEPPKMTSPVPLRNCVALLAPCSKSRLALPAVASVTFPPESTSPPLTLRSALLPTLTSPASVTPVKVTVEEVGVVTDSPAPV